MKRVPSVHLALTASARRQKQRKRRLQPKAGSWHFQPFVLFIIIIIICFSHLDYSAICHCHNHLPFCLSRDPDPPPPLRGFPKPLPYGPTRPILPPQREYQTPLLGREACKPQGRPAPGPTVVRALRGVLHRRGHRPKGHHPARGDRPQPDTRDAGSQLPPGTCPSVPFLDTILDTGEIPSGEKPNAKLHVRNLTKLFPLSPGFLSRWDPAPIFVSKNLRLSPRLE